MKISKKEFERLTKAWQQLYHEKENQIIPDRWQTKVMQTVRNIGAIPIKADPFTPFGQLVWRLAPVTILLIIVSAALLVTSGFAPENYLLISWITGAEDISLNQLLPL